jgi:ABC-type phosphonate transport system ATPase subunit
MLGSLRIQGFRGFRDLTIPRLGRVNLIVGRNNVGKTTILEALSVYAAGEDALKEAWSASRLFYQSADGASETSASISDPGNASESLELALEEVGILDRDPDEDPDARQIDSEFHLEAHHRRARMRGSQHQPVKRLALPEDRSDDGPHRYRLADGSTACQFILGTGIDSTDAAQLWRSVVLTDGEQDVQEALRILAPDIMRVSVLEVPPPGRPVPIVRRKHRKGREALRALGDGMNRLFEIALALVNSKGGFFLIDEFENGIHYAVQEQLWRLVFETAGKLDVQVFATTHSWDCIQAFEAAARARSGEGLLIRLAEHGGDIVAAVFDEHEVGIATRQAIEVR